MWSLQDANIKDGTIRVALGIETIEDLIADFAQALQAIGTPSVCQPPGLLFAKSCQCHMCRLVHHEHSRARAFAGRCSRALAIQWLGGVVQLMNTHPAI